MRDPRLDALDKEWTRLTGRETMISHISRPSETNHHVAFKNTKVALSIPEATRYLERLIQAVNDGMDPVIAWDEVPINKKRK